VDEEDVRNVPRGEPQGKPGLKGLAQIKIGRGHDDDACRPEGLVPGDEPYGHGRFEDARVIGKLVAEGAHGRGQHVAHQKGHDHLLDVQVARAEQGPGCGQPGRELGGHVEDDDAHGLGRQPGHAPQMFGHELLQIAEHPVDAHEMNTHVGGDGEQGDGPDAALETGPAFVQGAFEGHPVLAQVTDHAALGQGRQEQAADEQDAQGAQHGGQKRQAHVEKGRRTQKGRGDEKHVGQVQEIGGQAVEEVGQNQLARGEALFGIGLGEHGVGGHAGKKAHGEAGPDHVLHVPHADQRRGEAGHEAGPVEGLDEVGHQKAHGQRHKQTGQGPPQGAPQFGHIHAQGSYTRGVRRARGICGGPGPRPGVAAQIPVDAEAGFD